MVYCLLRTNLENNRQVPGMWYKDRGRPDHQHTGEIVKTKDMNTVLIVMLKT